MSMRIELQGNFQRVGGNWWGQGGGDKGRTPDRQPVIWRDGSNRSPNGCRSAENQGGTGEYGPTGLDKVGQGRRRLIHEEPELPCSNGRSSMRRMPSTRDVIAST